LANTRFEAHIPGMNSATQPITVVFACPQCGSVYRASQYRGMGAHFGVFNCVSCHAQVYAWSGLYDFLDWQLGLLTGGAQTRPGTKS
jgi:predicted RNA-binding Zn-ribbon protein involved in translation (DUF1610 family)